MDYTDKVKEIENVISPIFKTFHPFSEYEIIKLLNDLYKVLIQYQLADPQDSERLLKRYPINIRFANLPEETAGLTVSEYYNPGYLQMKYFGKGLVDLEIEICISDSYLKRLALPNDQYIDRDAALLDLIQTIVHESRHAFQKMSCSDYYLTNGLKVDSHSSFDKINKEYKQVIDGIGKDLYRDCFSKNKNFFEQHMQDLEILPEYAEYYLKEDEIDARNFSIHIQKIIENMDFFKKHKEEYPVTYKNLVEKFNKTELIEKNYLELYAYIDKSLDNLIQENKKQIIGTLNKNPNQDYMVLKEKVYKKNKIKKQFAKEYWDDYPLKKDILDSAFCFMFESSYFRNRDSRQTLNEISDFARELFIKAVNSGNSNLAILLEGHINNKEGLDEIYIKNLLNAINENNVRFYVISDFIDKLPLEQQIDLILLTIDKKSYILSEKLIMAVDWENLINSKVLDKLKSNLTIYKSSKNHDKKSINYLDSLVETWIKVKRESMRENI